MEISSSRSSAVAVTTDANIARHLLAMAAQRPELAALKVPRGRTADGRINYLTLTFAELADEAAAWRARLARAGVRRGDRVLVMVRPGLPLIAGVFATFQLGAVPVIIDPGMGLKSFLACVERSRPRVLLGIGRARVLSRVFRRAFRSIAVRVPVASSLTARMPRGGVTPPEPATCAEDELAAILFTSGSTGRPKGVCYEHGMFEAQVRLVRETYAIEPGEVDLPLLPVFALFNPALGMTTVVPEVDPRRPATLDPAKVVQAIQQERVTNSFGSPTLWRKIGDHCRARGITLPTLRRVLCAGAPVPRALWTTAGEWLANGELHSPYGATEALPVSSVSRAEMLRLETAVTFGACVGRPVALVDVRVIAIDDGPIRSWAEVHELPPGEVGEIVVRGPMVTRVYGGLPEATAAAKINGSGGTEEGRSAVWHRLGDCGYRDADGRIWFCGRKAERVRMADRDLHTEPVEQVFRQHPRAARCALIGLGPPGAQTPALVVEAGERGAAAQALAGELRALAKTRSHTAVIRRFYFRAHFPVDVRHNAKIHRLTLAAWAARARAYDGGE